MLGLSVMSDLPPSNLQQSWRSPTSQGNLTKVSSTFRSVALKVAPAAHREFDPSITSTFSSGAPQDFKSPDQDNTMLQPVVSMVQCSSGHYAQISM